MKAILLMTRSPARLATRGMLCLAACTLVAHAASSGQEASTVSYVRADSWAETMLSSRRSLARDPGSQAFELGPWYASAPLPARTFAEALFPEEGIDLAAKDDAGKKLWKKRAKYVDGVVHGLPRRDRASTYLYRTITVRKAMTRAASLGSDDGIEVWLNGEKVLSRDVARGPGVDQERVELQLVPGENHLLLKIHNNTGGHGFYFSMRQSEVLTIWNRIEADFPLECAWFRRDLPGNGHLGWFHEAETVEESRELVTASLKDLSIGKGELRDELDLLRASGASSSDPAWLELYLTLCRIREAKAALAELDLDALERAVVDLTASYPAQYGAGDDLARELATHRRRLAPLEEALLRGDREAAAEATAAIEEITAFKRRALLANPLLEIERLLLVKRQASGPKLGLPQNWQGNCALPRSGYDDELVTLSPVTPDGELATFYRPETPRFVGDVDLDFDAERMLFSMLGSHDRWQIWELDAAGESPRQVTAGEEPDVDNYDACYLPDGRILFGSTRIFQGVPCVGGADAVANLHVMDADGGSIRRLCFDQDHDWCPTVLNNGRVLFTRWEYSDTPHYFTRLLMHMNPDGTGQMEYYGSNSFWPNSIFYARPIPGETSQVVAIVSGHHGVPRMGELVIFDPAKGRYEADGVVQRIPGWGKEVEPVIVDQLVNNSWPRFLNPYPLSEKYFLVSCQPSPDRPWGIWLVDVFDNLLCLAEEPGFALMEPIPFRPTPRPPVIPDRVRLDTDEATVFLGDVYRGPGLEGVPRGTVKSLRVFEFHYGYNKIGGHKHVGIEGPWDVHRLLGTVPVYEDGSAAFTVPANTPLAVQPLDADGRAVQLMRSWFTAMPGEMLSCVGCHEAQNAGPAVRPTIAARQRPREIEPWYGPTRGFSFKREVQPVLDEYCVGCHDGETPPDLRRSEKPGWRGFTPSYVALHPFVRRPGPESDYHLLPAMEYHASTSELVQLLEKGHYGVELDFEGWDRIVTWIDLNVPDHGTWKEHTTIPEGLAERRREMSARYAGRDEDPEEILPMATEAVAFVAPTRPSGGHLAWQVLDGWPLSAEEAAHVQASVELGEELILELGEELTMKLVPIPAGEFLMGDRDGLPDESPERSVTIDEPFYLSTLEVTREQFSLFDPAHHNGYHDQNHKDHTTPGYPANGPQRPVIRVSWERATAYCEWLSERTGLTCTLPTEAEWEWACRAGTDTSFSWGGLDTDFGSYANLADASTSRLAVSGVNPQPIPNPSPYEDWLPKEARFDDGNRLMCDVGRYQPNRWGLYDMHGNVSEWTLSDYRPYPYRSDDGRNAGSARGDKVARGGSWRNRPSSARSAWRVGYRPWQRVHDVGFRVVVHP